MAFDIAAFTAAFMAALDDPKIYWLVVFVGLYWAYCLFWGIKGAIGAKTAADYMIAGRSLGIWVFALAATATSFSGWTFVGHAGSVHSEGFPYAYAAFYAIAIPFTGVLFLKRQWLLSRRFGFVTPGEMLHAYFKSYSVRLLTVLVALLFSVFFLSIQLRASGFLFDILTEGALGDWVSTASGGLLGGVEAGMWLLSIVFLIYIVSGGLRAVAHAGALQGILLMAGITVLGVVALYYAPDITTGIAALSHVDPATGEAAFGQITADGYSSYIAVPGVVHMVGNGPTAQGGIWTGVMILTYMFALMGIQSSPAFSMWAFASKSAAAFGLQQVWLSSFLVGLILLVFATLQGVGAHFLGTNPDFMAVHPELVNPVLGVGPEGRESHLVPQLIALVNQTTPWLGGLLAICALAAMQSTGAAYMSTTGSILSRDLLPNTSDSTQKRWARIGALLVLGAALYVATHASDALTWLGGLALAYGLQMWPALIAVCWWPFLTRSGVNLGLIAGLVAVTMTETIGQHIFMLLGVDPLWGRWPLTIHSAGWGIVCNLSVAILVSAITQSRADRAHRMTFHNVLREHMALPNDKKGLVPLAWIMTLAWFFFGVGPGTMIGNTVFGDPNDPSTWLFGIPSIWTWQILFWVLGCFMMWFLAYRMELSTSPRRTVDNLFDETPASGMTAASAR